MNAAFIRAGMFLISQERERQINEEGYKCEHDDRHATGELAEAAQCYLTVGSAGVRGSSAVEWPVEMFDGFHDSLIQWPFEDEWWKPEEDPIRNLVKAGALIAAEIDRLLRLCEKAEQEASVTPPAQTSFGDMR